MHLFKDLSSVEAMEWLYRTRTRVFLVDLTSKKPNTVAVCVRLCLCMYLSGFIILLDLSTDAVRKVPMMADQQGTNTNSSGVPASKKLKLDDGKW